MNKVGFRTATSAVRAAPAEVVARLEQVAAVLLDVPIEELIVNLLHHGVEPPGLAIERHLGEAGPWRWDAQLATHVEEQLLAHASRILEAVAEVEFLEPVVILAGDELVEVDFEGLLVARVHVAGIALQPNPHAVHDVRATHVRQGQVRGDVFVFVCLVVGLQQRPKVRLRECEVNGDDLIDRENVVAVDLGEKHLNLQQETQAKRKSFHGNVLKSRGVVKVRRAPGEKVESRDPICHTHDASCDARAQAPGRESADAARRD